MLTLRCLPMQIQIYTCTHLSLHTYGKLVWKARFVIYVHLQFKYIHLFQYLLFSFFPGIFLFLFFPGILFSFFLVVSFFSFFFSVVFFFLYFFPLFMCLGHFGVCNINLATTLIYLLKVAIPLALLVFKTILNAIKAAINILYALVSVWHKSKIRNYFRNHKSSSSLPI